MYRASTPIDLFLARHLKFRLGGAPGRSCRFRPLYRRHHSLPQGDLARLQTESWQNGREVDQMSDRDGRW